MNLGFYHTLKLSIGLPVLVFLLATTLGSWALWKNYEGTRRLAEADIPLEHAINEMYAQGLQMGQALRNIALDHSNKQGRDNFSKASVSYDEAAERAAKLAKTPEYSEPLAEIASLRIKHKDAQQRVLQLIETDGAAALQVLVKQETVAWREMRTKLLDLRKLGTTAGEVSRADMMARGHLFMLINIVLGTAALLCAIVTFAWLARRVNRELGGEPAVAGMTMRAIAAGDLSCHVDVAKGDTHSLMAAVRDTVAALQRLVGEVRKGVDEVRSAATSIAEGNQLLSDRTEQAASSLEETAATMEQFTATIQANNSHVGEARSMIGEATRAANQGRAVFDQFVGTMTEISHSSRKISDIIGVIDGIAFQTNILALNAAVEAARAGEQGRGFAVVASEVRSLAGRSATAAREIKALIEDSVHKVDDGSRLVVDAERWMKDIAGHVGAVNEVVERISVASQEQAEGIQQVNAAVIQLDQTTQQNSAMVEAGAQAATRLQAQAERLTDAVSVFKQ